MATNLKGLKGGSVLCACDHKIQFNKSYTGEIPWLGDFFQKSIYTQSEEFPDWGVF